MTFRTRALLLGLAIALILPASFSQSFAQFAPCKIVNFDLSSPQVIQAGQPFQISTKLTVSCDPSAVGGFRVRVDLLNASSLKTLSTVSTPYFLSSLSFVVTLVNQATAPQATAPSWALQIQAYVLNPDGYSLAQTSYLFQVAIEPYTPPASTTQTTEAATYYSVTQPTVTNQSALASTYEPLVTSVTSSTQIAFSTQASGGASADLLLPLTIVLLGIAVLVGLLLASRKRS